MGACTVGAIHAQHNSGAGAGAGSHAKQSPVKWPKRGLDEDEGCGKCAADIQGRITDWIQRSIDDLLKEQTRYPRGFATVGHDLAAEAGLKQPITDTNRGKSVMSQNASNDEEGEFGIVAGNIGHKQKRWSAVLPCCCLDLVIVLIGL